MSVNINMEAEDEGHSPLASSETDVIMTAEEFQMFKSTYIVSIEKTAEELRELQIEQEKMEAEKSKMQKRIFEMENGLNKLSLSSTSAQEALRRLDLERDVSKIIENGLQEAKIQGLLEKMRHLKAQLEETANPEVESELANQCHEAIEEGKRERSQLLNATKNFGQYKRRFASELKELEESKNKEETCTHCRQQYLPSENGPEACLFHPGRLKFYSCRKCGADEYHICCNTCSECSAGCRRGKHEPVAS